MTNSNYEKDLQSSEEADSKLSKPVVYVILFVIIILIAMYIYGRMVLAV